MRGGHDRSPSLQGFREEYCGRGKTGSCSHFGTTFRLIHRPMRAPLTIFLIFLFARDMINAE
jgi:hypothetical protein